MVKRVLLLIAGFLLFPTVNQADVTLTMGTGSGYRGSYNNPVSVSLSNPLDKVRKVQMEVCDVGGYVTEFTCDTTARSRDGFTCSIIPLGGGCGRIILNAYTGGFIPAGTGSIMTVRYNVASGAPSGQCRALNLQNVYVLDEQSDLVPSSPVAGSFCFSSCTQSSQCEDGLYCNGTDACSSGVCTHTGNPCPGTQCKTCQEDTNTCTDPAGTYCVPYTPNSDGLFCNGDEICNGSGSCVHTGSPCPDATCVEAQDLCTCGLDQTCEDNKFCTQDDVCLFGVCEHIEDPCTAQGLHCSEEVGRCICFVDAECDDNNDCTDDRCEADGSCRNINNANPCDDGIFCNGIDTCGCETCNHSGDPCTYPSVCYEETNTCGTRQVEMTLGFGSGVIGSLSSVDPPVTNLMNVQLKNPSREVDGILMTVCDENDYLILAGCKVVDAYKDDFDCVVNELSNGCGTAALAPKGTVYDPILPGPTTKTIFNIGFDVAPCRKRGTACTAMECSVSHEPCKQDSDCGPGRCSVSTLLCNSNFECGRCSISQSSCVQQSDCPSGQTCVYSETCVFSETCSEIVDCGCYQQGATCSAGAANCYRFDRTKLCDCEETDCYFMEDSCPPADTGDVWVTIEDLKVNDPLGNQLGALAVPTPFENFTVTCDSNADCSRGSVCSTDTCSGVNCVHTPSGVVTCNDGIFCTLTDRCSGGYCVGTGDTCGSVFLCDEEADQCLSCPGDADCDGVPDSTDNCPSMPNGSNGGICIAGSAKGAACLDHCDCDLLNGYCTTAQEDSYPPGGNTLGDACECEGNFDGNLTVDGLDAAVFKADYGRSGIKRPCTTLDPCNGDFGCNGNVDGLDAAVFKGDFGRSGIKNPCPPSETDPWCVYP